MVGTERAVEANGGGGLREKFFAMRAAWKKPRPRSLENAAEGGWQGAFQVIRSGWLWYAETGPLAEEPHSAAAAVGTPRGVHRIILRVVEGLIRQFRQLAQGLQ